MSGYTSIVDASPGFVAGTFDARDVRFAALGNARPGLFASGDFAVTQRAAGANMSVDIAAGRAFVDPGYTLGGVYMAHQLTSFNTSADGGYTWTAADATNPRIDLLCIEVADADMGGSYTGWKFRIVDGTPNASATHQLMTTYWPAIPTGCVPIAAIKIPATDTTISTTDITNLNPVGGIGRSPYIKNSTAETTTSATYTRLSTPDFLCVYLPHADCRVRVFSEGWWKCSVASGTQAVALFLNDTQLKSRNPANAGPGIAERTYTSLSTFHGRFVTGQNTATGECYLANGGATADVTDVTTGLAGWANTVGVPSPIEIAQLAAGWYVIEQRYKTSANTLTVDERRMWAEVVG
jgi:hypothetical protein